MKSSKEYEDQILKSLEKVPFQMKKIKFLIFLGKNLNKIKKNKSFILKLLVFLYAITMTILFFKK